ncbi:helix-turn-helix domain-containing protein [Streptomyces prasinus]|uniref:helix-turn-helix domain-containing protein n=1 Tax=Streptomyces prasinus TaxID=67345 RepID=UPI0036B05A03
MAISEGSEPGGARTSAEYVGLLRRLKERSGLTYRQLEERAAERGDVLARSTLADVLRRDALPRAEVVAALVRACGPEEDVAEWLAARERLAEGERLAGAERAERPEALGGDDAPESDRVPDADRVPDLGRLPGTGRGAPGTGRAPVDEAVEGRAAEGEAAKEGEAAGGGRTRTAPFTPLVALASLGTVVLLVIAAVVLLPDGQRTGDSKGAGPEASMNPAATPLAAGPTPGWSRVRPIGAPTLCLTEGEARVDGDTKTVAVQRPCTEAVPPRTYLQRESDGLYVIKWDHPDHGPACLTVLDGGPFHGMLEPWPWKACRGGSTAQRFRIEPAPGGGTDHWRFRPAQDAEPLCVGIRESAEDPDGSQGSDKAGAVAVAQRCTVQDANGQVFIIEPE